MANIKRIPAAPSPCRSSMTPPGSCGHLTLSDPATELRFARQERLRPIFVDICGRIEYSSNWIGVARAIVHWLIESGKLIDEQLPVPYADYPHRFFVCSDPSRFSTQTERYRAEDLGNGMFLNTQAGAELLMNNCRLLMERCGVAPKTAYVCWKSA